MYLNSYDGNNIPRARKLRKEMTSQERRMWYCFLREYPIKIYRQRAVDKYILDFYCSKAKLAIELDGGQHYEDAQMNYDKNRTGELNKLGIEVLRYTNLDVDKDFEAVCTDIDRKIRARLS